MLTGRQTFKDVVSAQYFLLYPCVGFALSIFERDTKTRFLKCHTTAQAFQRATESAFDWVSNAPQKDMSSPLHSCLRNSILKNVQ